MRRRMERFDVLNVWDAAWDAVAESEGSRLGSADLRALARGRPARRAAAWTRMARPRWRATSQAERANHRRVARTARQAHRRLPDIRRGRASDTGRGRSVAPGPGAGAR